jgi:hypothetical protein
MVRNRAGSGCARHEGFLAARLRTLQLLDRFQAKFKEVGFTRYDLGLPNCLVEIPGFQQLVVRGLYWAAGREPKDP